MDLIVNQQILRYEIWFLLINLGYIVFHLLFDAFSIFQNLKNLVSPKRRAIDEDRIKAAIQEKMDSIDSGIPNEVSMQASAVPEGGAADMQAVGQDRDGSESIEEGLQSEAGVLVEELSRDQKDILNEILKAAKNRVSRGEYSDAKAKIIEGLSIDKFNKDLNIMLASLYEKDKDYKKAELIYKDLIVINDHDAEIYLKLGFILSVQSKYEVAFEIYKKLHSLDKSNQEAIEMLANLAHHLGNYEDSKLYAKIIIRNNPRNIDILYMQALNCINLEQKAEGLELLFKVKNIEPYNVKVNELIEKIKIEIELEKNFNNQKS